MLVSKYKKIELGESPHVIARLDRAIQSFFMDPPVKPEDDNSSVLVRSEAPVSLRTCKATLHKTLFYTGLVPRKALLCAGSNLFRLPRSLYSLAMTCISS